MSILGLRSGSYSCRKLGFNPCMVHNWFILWLCCLLDKDGTESLLILLTLICTDVKFMRSCVTVYWEWENFCCCYFCLSYCYINCRCTLHSWIQQNWVPDCCIFSTEARLEVLTVCCHHVHLYFLIFVMHYYLLLFIFFLLCIMLYALIGSRDVWW